MRGAGAKDYIVSADIPYLGLAREERMDAYLPQAKGDAAGRSGVLVFHGGGWAGGSRKRERDVCFAKSLAQRGYCVFTVDYRLAERQGEASGSAVARGSWPECLYDCKTALRYVRKHAAEFGVDPERLAVAGGGAGAHLALMVGFTGGKSNWNAAGLYREVDASVGCVVAVREISDVRNEFSHWFIDPEDADDIRVQAMASPITHVERGGPPVLLVHGEGDELVGIERSRDLDRRLTRAGVEHRLITVPGGDHELRLDKNANDLMPTVDTFLRWHLLCR